MRATRLNIEIPMGWRRRSFPAQKMQKVALSESMTVFHGVFSIGDCARSVSGDRDHAFKSESQPWAK